MNGLVASEVAEKRRVITLTTDFGSVDGFAAVVKGVILSICSYATIVDISHELKPFDVRSAAWVLRNSYRYFPKGTIHVGVVDPEVGSARRPLLITTSAGCFLGPDNGLLSFLLEDKTEPAVVFELTCERFWRTPVCATFHGRDLFAPVAAHLANGVPPELTGVPVDAGSVLRLPGTKRGSGQDRLLGEVVYIDRFGNLITNIPNHMLDASAQVFLDGAPVGCIKTSYASAGPGQPVAVPGSHGFLEIAVFKGNASALLSGSVGSAVEVGRP